ncbi:putative quinol monooxygenase [Nocardiopsis sp. LOL_012]|uniref:putative quinol monooxygenase n=1 Tax=Nocardiopsis sp. LOL_012 TaxID=3345409 RepID=UPI003A891DEB
MLIISGSITVHPDQRERYLEGCAGIVEQARSAPGCLDFALSPDLLDPARINVYERWESATELEDFRGAAPSTGQEESITDASVARYVISSVEAP